MRNYREDIQPGDEWIITDDAGKHIVKVKSLIRDGEFGWCVYWQDDSWTTVLDLQTSQFAVPANEKPMPWTKEEVKEAIRMRLVPMKESGYNIDSEIVLDMLSSYTYDLTKCAFMKGQ